MNYDIRNNNWHTFLFLEIALMGFESGGVYNIYIIFMKKQK